MNCDKFINFAKDMISRFPDMEADKRRNLEEKLNKITIRSQVPYLNVAIIGDFSSGKSTFINAMLGMNILKVGWLATTAIPTKIYRGYEETAVVIAEDSSGNKNSLSNGSQRNRLEKKLNAKLPTDLQECIDFLSTSNQYAQSLKYIELYINTNQLDESMCIVDTPGVNPGAEGTEQHVNMTRNILREGADAAIVLLPAQAVLKNSFSQFLSENAQHFLDNAIFVVTMLDLVNENERLEILEFVKKNLSEQFDLVEPLVYGISAKRSIINPTLKKDFESSGEHWQEEFRQMQEEVYQFLKQRRDSIITGQLTKLLSQLLEDLDTEVKESTFKLNENLTILEKNSVENLKNEMQSCLTNADREFRYRQIEIKDNVLNEYSQNFENTKSSIRSSINLCDDIYGDGRWSIPYYYKNGLKTTLSDFQNKTETSVKKAAEELYIIVNQFYEKANSILHKYQMGLGEISVNSGESASNKLHEVSFDSAVTYDAYSDTTSAVQRTAEVATVLVAGVPALAIWAAGKLFDANFTYGFGDKFESKINKFGNFLASKLNAIEGARTRAYNTISGQLDAKNSTIKANLNEQLTKLFDGMLDDMQQAIPTFMDNYKEAFSEKQNEYDLKVLDANELIWQNEMKSYEIKRYMAELNGETYFFDGLSAAIKNGYYRIKTKFGKFVDIRDGCNENGVTAHIWAKANVESQKFFFERLDDGSYVITCKQSGKSLEVYWGSFDDCAPIVQWGFDESFDYKSWYVIDSGDGWYEFKNKETQKYMDIQGGNNSDGTILQQFNANGTDAQRFTLIPV